jgi:hypothetical protein
LGAREKLQSNNHKTTQKYKKQIMDTQLSKLHTSIKSTSHHKSPHPILPSPAETPLLAITTIPLTLLQYSLRLPKNLFHVLIVLECIREGLVECHNMGFRALGFEVSFVYQSKWANLFHLSVVEATVRAQSNLLE